MTWRKLGTALSIAATCLLAFGATTPVLSAGLDKATLLAGLNTDQSMITAWSRDVTQLTFLGAERPKILADLSSASSAVSQLRAKTAADTSRAALAADLRSFFALQAGLSSFEGLKVRAASTANDERAWIILDTRKIQLSGGLDSRSPIHSQTLAAQAKLRAAQIQLESGILMLLGARFVNLPGSRGSLTSAQSLINQAKASLIAADRLVIQLPLAGIMRQQFVTRTWVVTELLALGRLRAEVFADPNLSSSERANLMAQINADLFAFGQLNTFLAQGGHGTTLAAELAALLSKPGVFILIFPKTDIMIAAAAERSAIATLSGLIATLQSKIATAASGHADVTNLNSLLADLRAQLAGASADVAPIDSEFENMTAITVAQQSADFAVIQAAFVALTDGSMRLVKARADANQIQGAIA